MHLIFFYTVFLLDLLGKITCGLEQATSNNQTFRWSMINEPLFLDPSLFLFQAVR